MEWFLIIALVVIVVMLERIHGVLDRLEDKVENVFPDQNNIAI